MEGNVSCVKVLLFYNFILHIKSLLVGTKNVCVTPKPKMEITYYTSKKEKEFNLVNKISIQYSHNKSLHLKFFVLMCLLIKLNENIYSDM